MQPDRQRQQVLIGGRDVTDRCDQITYSSTDQGGYEIATLGLPAGDRPAKGTPVTIRSGLEVAWSGRVAEVSVEATHGLATRSVGCEGWVAVMRDNPMQMIYVDRDLTKWAASSTARQIDLVTLGETLGSFQALADASGSPSLAFTLPGAYTASIPQAEAWYDAGPGNLVGDVYVEQSATAMPAGWHMLLDAANDDRTTTGALLDYTTTPNRGYAFTSGVPFRYLLLAANAPLATNTSNATYLANFANVAVYGNHGLGGYGPDPQGVLPADVAGHALSQCAGILPGRIIPSLSYIAPHVTYPAPTTADVIVTDMAKLMGWPWGVWEPSSILGTQPRMDFAPPPTDATCVISRAECDQLDVTARLGDLYSTAEITYTDAAGVAGLATVTLPNPQLAEAGIEGRTLTLDLGVGSQPAAAAFGLFALQLSQVSARAAGQATLPACVRLAGGGSKPAHLIRPGIDRLRILDLADAGPLLDQGSVRRDTFRISRAETTVEKDGSASTRVEIDSGSNLLETLQARMALSAGVVGAGASGG